MSGEPAEQRMVNDISRQFRHLSPEEGAEAVASHIRRFWDPRMLARLLELADSEDASLDPLALDAASRLRV